MYRPLVPCPDCHRHVHASEDGCPFCGASLPRDLAAKAVPGASQRLSRAAAFVFGATVVVSGCSGEVQDGRAASGSDEGSTSGGGGGGDPDAGPNDDGGNAALYGLPAPRDAGPDGPDDDGGGMAEYGAPPGPDGGLTMDGGGGQPLYGAPPPE